MTMEERNLGTLEGMMIVPPPEFVPFVAFLLGLALVVAWFM